MGNVWDEAGLAGEVLLGVYMDERDQDEGVPSQFMGTRVGCEILDDRE